MKEIKIVNILYYILCRKYIYFIKTSERIHILTDIKLVIEMQTSVTPYSMQFHAPDLI